MLSICKEHWLAVLCSIIKSYILDFWFTLLCLSNNNHFFETSLIKIFVRLSSILKDKMMTWVWINYHGLLSLPPWHNLKKQQLDGRQPVSSVNKMHLCYILAVHSFIHSFIESCCMCMLHVQPKIFPIFLQLAGRLPLAPILVRRTVIFMPQIHNKPLYSNR